MKEHVGLISSATYQSAAFHDKLYEKRSYISVIIFKFSRKFKFLKKRQNVEIVACGLSLNWSRR